MPYKLSKDGTTQLVGRQQLTLGQRAFTRVDDGTEQLNIDGRALGDAEVLWNGTGGGDSGGDWSVSGEGSETAESAYSGTYGWDSGATVLNDSTVFDYGSSIDIAGTYDTLQFWIQPKAWPTDSRLVARWLDGADSQVGVRARVEDYTVNMDLDVWQQVEIPIEDFELTGNVQKLEFWYRATSGQQHWFDDLELVTLAGGGPYRFRVAAPDANTFFHLTMMVVLVAGPQTGWNANSFGSISGGLSRGMLLRQRRLSDGEILWRLNSKDNTDLFGRYHPQDDVLFYDGTLLIGFMIKPGEASVVISHDEVLEIVVRDDLSSITNMRAFAHYGVETK
jgi:hypothetical protein